VKQKEHMDLLITKFILFNRNREGDKRSLHQKHTHTNAILTAIFRWTWFSQLPSIIRGVEEIFFIWVRCISSHPTNNGKALAD